MACLHSIRLSGGWLPDYHVDRRPTTLIVQHCYSKIPRTHEVWAIGRLQLLDCIFGTTYLSTYVILTSPYWNSTSFWRCTWLAEDCHALRLPFSEHVYKCTCLLNRVYSPCEGSFLPNSKGETFPWAQEQQWPHAHPDVTVTQQQSNQDYPLRVHHVGHSATVPSSTDKQRLDEMTQCSTHYKNIKLLPITLGCCLTGLVATLATGKAERHRSHYENLQQIVGARHITGWMPFLTVTKYYRHASFFTKWFAPLCHNYN